DGRRSLGKTGDGCQRHDRVADGIHIQVQTAQRPAVDGDASRTLLDAATHVGEEIDKRVIALQAVRRKVEDGDAAAGEGRRGEKVAGRGSVRFDVVGAERAGTGLHLLSTGDVETDALARMPELRGSQESMVLLEIRTVAVQVIAALQPPLSQH